MRKQPYKQIEDRTFCGEGVVLLSRAGQREYNSLLICGFNNISNQDKVTFRCKKIAESTVRPFEKPGILFRIKARESLNPEHINICEDFKLPITQSLSKRTVLQGYLAIKQ